MNVSAVIVCYEPDLVVLRRNLESMAADPCRVVIYDNSESRETSQRLQALSRDSGATYLGGEGNVGVATAQNRSVATLARFGDGCVVFLDQDSLLPTGFVARLSASYDRLRTLDPAAGVLGAQPVGENGQPLPLKVLGATGPYLQVDSVISSGSIVALADLLAAGGFRDDLFIDLVDNEFCWRMRRSAHRCYVDPGIPFQHSVGDGRFVRALGFSSPVSAPFRGYYQTRNLILLGRSGVLSWSAVVRGLAKRTGAIVLSATTQGGTAARLRFLARGIWDGCRARGGKMP